MGHGVGEARVGVVLGVGDVERLRGDPAPEPRARPRLPREGPARHRLVEAVDSHGRVGRGAAEEVAPGRLRRVAKGAGVRDGGLAEHRALDAQEIGVAVTGADRAAERTRIEDELMRPAIPRAPHHAVAALGKQHRRRRLGGPRRRATRRRSARGRRATAPRRPGPARPTRSPACRNTAAATANTPRRSPRGRGASGRSEPPSASPIAGIEPSGCAERQEHVDHALEPLGDLARQRHAVPRREQHEVQVDLDRVAVVAGRPLEVERRRAAPAGRARRRESGVRGAATAARRAARETPDRRRRARGPRR